MSEYIWLALGILIVAGVTYLMVVISDQMKAIREEKRRDDITKGIRR